DSFPILLGQSSHNDRGLKLLALCDCVSSVALYAAHRYSKTTCVACVGVRSLWAEFHNVVWPSLPSFRTTELDSHNQCPDQHQPARSVRRICCLLPSSVGTAVGLCIFLQHSRGCVGFRSTSYGASLRS